MIDPKRPSDLPPGPKKDNDHRPDDRPPRPPPGPPDPPRPPPGRKVG